MVKSILICGISAYDGEEITKSVFFATGIINVATEARKGRFISFGFVWFSIRI